MDRPLDYEVLARRGRRGAARGRRRSRCSGTRWAARRPCRSRCARPELLPLPGRRRHRAGAVRRRRVRARPAPAGDARDRPVHADSPGRTPTSGSPSTCDDARVRAFLLQNLAREGGGWTWRADLELLARDLTAVADFPVPADARPYDGPVLWVAGADSPYVRDEHRERMSELFPRARLVRLKGAGHWVHAEVPELFAQTVDRFLDRGRGPGLRRATAPRSRAGGGAVAACRGGAEGIRTPDPLDANEVRYRTALQPPSRAGHYQPPTTRRCSYGALLDRGRRRRRARRAGGRGALGLVPHVHRQRDRDRHATPRRRPAAAPRLSCACSTWAGGAGRGGIRDGMTARARRRSGAPAPAPGLLPAASRRAAPARPRAAPAARPRGPAPARRAAARFTACRRRCTTTTSSSRGEPAEHRQQHLGAGQTGDDGGADDQQEQDQQAAAPAGGLAAHRPGRRVAPAGADRAGAAHRSGRLDRGVVLGRAPARAPARARAPGGRGRPGAARQHPPGVGRLTRGDGGAVQPRRPPPRTAGPWGRARRARHRR